MENPSAQPFFSHRCPFIIPPYSLATVLRVSCQTSLCRTSYVAREKRFGRIGIYLANYRHRDRRWREREIGRRMRGVTRGRIRGENGPPSVISWSQPPSQADKLLHPPPGPFWYQIKPIPYHSSRGWLVSLPMSHLLCGSRSCHWCQGQSNAVHYGVKPSWKLGAS